MSSEEFDEHMKRISGHLTSLPSIRSAEVKAKLLKVVPRLGLLPTNIGGDIGADPATHVSTGYANFFRKGEVFEVKGSYSASKSPSLTVSYTHPLFANADFSLPIPFSKVTTSLTFDSRQIVSESITTGQFEASFLPRGKPLNLSGLLSFVSEKVTPTSSIAFALDPSPYLKICVKAETLPLFPYLSGSVESGILRANQRFTPFLKLNALRRFNLGFGFSALFGCGALMSKRAVPYAEKFRIGGVPTAYGIDHEKFGTSIGGFPSGCDKWASATLDFTTLLLPEYGLDVHVFVNGAVARNEKSHNVIDLVPTLTKVLSVGAGLQFVQGGVKIQANLQFPYHSSAGLNFSRFQIGFCPN
jgi:outer membrane protein assembly factor BamA